MKIEDLSIGDWVAYRDADYSCSCTYSRVCRLTLSKYSSEEFKRVVELEDGTARVIDLIDSVPITRERLEWIGFAFGNSSLGEMLIDKNTLITYDIDNTVRVWKNVLRHHSESVIPLVTPRDLLVLYTEVNGLHQIQHILRMFGYDKEVMI